MPVGPPFKRGNKWFLMTALRKSRAARDFRKAVIKNHLLPLLKGGPTGIQKFNLQWQCAQNLCWNECQLAGANLKGVHFEHFLELHGSNFENANLEEAFFR